MFDKKLLRQGSGFKLGADMRKISVPFEADSRETVRRYGFECAMGLLIADHIGGLWFLSPSGAGFELVAPHRSCSVADFKESALNYQRDPSFSLREIQITLCDCDCKPA